VTKLNNDEDDAVMVRPNHKYIYGQYTDQMKTFTKNSTKTVTRIASHITL